MADAEQQQPEQQAAPEEVPPADAGGDGGAPEAPAPADEPQQPATAEGEAGEAPQPAVDPAAAAAKAAAIAARLLVRTCSRDTNRALCRPGEAACPVCCLRFWPVLLPSPPISPVLGCRPPAAHPRTATTSGRVRTRRRRCRAPASGRPAPWRAGLRTLRAPTLRG